MVSAAVIEGDTVCNDGPFYVGGSPWYSSFSGKINYLTVYDRGLTADEVNTSAEGATFHLSMEPEDDMDHIYFYEGAMGMPAYISNEDSAKCVEPEPEMTGRCFMPDEQVPVVPEPEYPEVLNCSELTSEYYNECDANNQTWDESIIVEGYTLD